LAHGVERVASI